jgi:hypothetical protein
MCQLQTSKMRNDFCDGIATNIYVCWEWLIIYLAMSGFHIAKLVSEMLPILFRSSVFLELILAQEKHFFYLFLVNPSIYQTTLCHTPEHNKIDTHFHVQAIYKIPFLPRIKRSNLPKQLQTG